LRLLVHRQFFSRVCRWIGKRQPSQGLIEYSLITATVALMGVAGLNALSLAQRQYFVGVESELDGPVPGVPGALLHPTLIDRPSCSVGGIQTVDVYVSDNVSCQTTVHDTFSNPFDLKRPLGELHWYLDGSFLGYCALTDASPGASNTCGLPWVPAPAQIGTRDLVAVYCPIAKAPNCTRTVPPAWAPPSNHIESPPSAPLTLTIKGDVMFKSVVCVNEIVGSISPSGEIGHPVNCTAHVTRRNGITDVSGQQIEWRTDNTTHNGVGMFTCGTDPNVVGYDDPIIWAGNAPCNQPVIAPNGPATLSCISGSNGKCSVLYRALFDSSGRAIGTHALDLTAINQFVSTSATVTIVAPSTVVPTTYHGSFTTFRCQNPSANVTPDNTPPGAPTVFAPAAYNPGRNLPFTIHTTDGINVTGPSGTVECTATVFDTDPTPALEDMADTNNADAYPPMGIVEFELEGIGVVGACSLRMVEFAALPTQQAKGQAPFISNCTTTPPLNGPITLTRPAAMSNPRLYARYQGEQVPGMLGHNTSEDWITVQFVP